VWGVSFLRSVGGGGGGWVVRWRASVGTGEGKGRRVFGGGIFGFG